LKEEDMERIWLKSYPEGLPAEIDADTFTSIGKLIAASVEKLRDS
jgi:long-chain acyl-CoA synthetase